MIAMTKFQPNTFEQLLTDNDIQIILIMYLLQVPDYPSRIVENFSKAIEDQAWTHHGKKDGMRDMKTIKKNIKSLEENNIIKRYHEPKITAKGKTTFYQIIPEILFNGLQVLGSDSESIDVLKTRHANRSTIPKLERQIMDNAEPPNVDHRVQLGPINRNISIVLTNLIPNLIEANREVDNKLVQDKEKVRLVIETINKVKKFNYISLLIYITKMLIPIRLMVNNIRCLNKTFSCGCEMDSKSNCWTVDAVKNIDNYTIGVNNYFQSMFEVEMNAICLNESISENCETNMNRIIDSAKIYNLKDFGLKIKEVIEQELRRQYGDQFSYNKQYPELFYDKGSVDIVRLNFAIKAQNHFLTISLIENLADIYGIMNITDFYPKLIPLMPLE